MRKQVSMIAKAGMIAAALMGTLFFMASPASAAPSTSTTGAAQETSASVPVPAVWDCYDIAYQGDRWTGWCQVYSGEMRTITYCANGRVAYGAWIYARPEPWFVYGDCPGSRVTAVVEQGR
jgi:hypothetical protein